MMAAYHVGTDTSSFELDHLVPLELGGAPSDPRNLWPEAHARPSRVLRFLRDFAWKSRE
jgi:hypothetical protein